MSNTTLLPFALAMRIALSWAASLFGREKCVPVTTMERADATKASSTSSSHSAMSAQSVRTKIIGETPSSSTESRTSAVSRSLSVVMPSTDTPSRTSCSRMKRPICSSPTRVSSAERRPSRAVPTEMLVGQPPTALVKDAMSSSREPICWP